MHAPRRFDAVKANRYPDYRVEISRFAISVAGATRPASGANEVLQVFR